MIDPIEFINPTMNIHKSETYNQKFSNYKMICLDYKNRLEKKNEKKIYIIGVYPEAATEDNYLLEFDKLELLKSLLELAKIIYPALDDNDEVIQSQQQFVIEKIISWCKKYGLPCIDDNLNYLPANDNESNLGFELMDFIIQIIILYRDFNLWYGINNERYDIIRKFDPDYYQYKSYHENEIINLKEYLAYNIRHFIKLRPKYNSAKKKFEIIANADDVLTAAYYQYTLLLINEGHESIDICNCGNFFIKNHGRRKRCSECQSLQNSQDVKNFRIRKEKVAKKYIIKKYENCDITAEDIFNIEKDYISNTIGKSTPFNVRRIEKWLCNKGE